MHPLKVWLSKASRLERKVFLSTAKVSTSLIYKIIGGTRTPSAEIASEIELATKMVSKGSFGRLEPVRRYEICETCRKCPYAPTCAKESKE